MQHCMLHHHAPVLSLAWGNAVLISAGIQAHIWETDTGKLQACLRGQNGRTRVVASSPGPETRIACASGTQIAIWNWQEYTDPMQANLQPLVIYTGHTSWVNTLMWSPDGERIASGSSDGTVQIWESRTAKPLLTYIGHRFQVHSLAWSPDGTQIASAGEQVQVWDPTTGVCYGVYHGHSESVYAVSWSPDGRLVASAGSDATVQIWEAESGVLHTHYQEHHAPVFALAWSPDGAAIASAGDDRTVRVWSVATGEKSASMVYRGHRRCVKALAWSPDGSLMASGSFDGTVQIWEPVPVFPASWMPFLTSQQQGIWLGAGEAHGRAVPWLVLKCSSELQVAHLEAVISHTATYTNGQLLPGLLLTCLFTVGQEENVPLTRAHMAYSLCLSPPQDDAPLISDALYLLTEAHTVYISAFSESQPDDPPQYLWEKRWHWSSAQRQAVAQFLASLNPGLDSTAPDQ